jgi:hypothetical protein
MFARSALRLAAVLIIAGCAPRPVPSPGPVQRPTQPLPRAEAFFGVHFDLHPSATDTSLGADITEENIEHLLTRVRPDWIQYDCKGHAGYTGYPTKVGTASPGIVKDSLAIWRCVPLLCQQWGVDRLAAGCLGGLAVGRLNQACAGTGRPMYPGGGWPARVDP